MATEVGLVAEQPEAVGDLPVDLQFAGRGSLGAAEGAEARAR